MSSEPRTEIDFGNYLTEKQRLLDVANWDSYFCTLGLSLESSFFFFWHLCSPEKSCPDRRVPQFGVQYYKRPNPLLGLQRPRLCRFGVASRCENHGP